MKNKKYMELIPFIPCIGNVVSIIISNISYEARYGYPTIVLIPLILIYSINVLNCKNEKKVIYNINV